MAVDSPETPLLNVYRVNSLPSYGSDDPPPAYSRPVTNLGGFGAYVTFPYSPPPTPVPDTREHYTETIYACQHSVCYMQMLPVPNEDVETIAGVSGWLFEGDAGNPQRVFKETLCDICFEDEKERGEARSEVQTAGTVAFGIMLWFVSAVIILRLLLGFFMIV
ncbi:MAG: hypothetical protein M1812_007155 [Candelaria pacifica]|nr:MAG: hypothetical protein M1812_007155 [Candelaria pacifica]